MTENTQTYGYTDDNQELLPGLQFGLNPSAAYLTKFEFNPNGGKDGTAQDCLDIIFTVNGKEISYRQFPVVKAFDGETEITDPKHPKMQEAFRDFNSIITHILHAFVDKDVIKVAMQVPIKGFKHYCEIAAGILPADYQKVALDLFAQWQWQVTGDNDKTYLRLPKNMKQGKWLCRAVTPVGEWKEVIRKNNKLKYLTYEDDEGNVHPFTRSQWFMESNFAKQQIDETVIPNENADFSGEQEKVEPQTEDSWT